MSAMDDGMKLAHQVNHLVTVGNEVDARKVSEQAVQTILNAEVGHEVFRVKCVPTQNLRRGFRRSHIEIEMNGTSRLLFMSEDIVIKSFTNWIDAFCVIGSIFRQPDLAEAQSGFVLFDIEDGSPGGDYARAAFCAVSRAATLVIDSYFNKYRGYVDLRKAIAEAWVAWSSREPVIFWRGSSTGMRRFTPRPEQASNWEYLPRLDLTHRANTSLLKNCFDVGISKIVQIDEPYLIQALRTSDLVRGPCAKLDFLKYRYIIDIDGNANAWDGLFSAMLMGACILKVQSPVGWREWYYDRLLPWEHFVPVRADLSDLEEAASWALSHERECSEMGNRVRALALDINYHTELVSSSQRVAAMLG